MFRFTYLLATALLLLPGTQHQAVATPRVLMNSPGSTEVDREIIDKIRSIRKGGEILGAYYSINDILDANGDSLEAALRNAADKGVSIHIISEANPDRSGGSDFMSLLAGDYNNVEYTTCHGGCLHGSQSEGMDRDAIMHSKLWVMKTPPDQAGDLPSTHVYIGSNDHSTTHQDRHGHLLVFEDDYQVYSIFRDYFYTIRSFRSMTTTAWPGPELLADKARFYFFPRETADPIVGELIQIIPQAGACTIHIAMATWTTANSRAGIGNKLIDLSKRGCSVNLIINSDSGSAAIDEFTMRPVFDSTDHGNNPVQHNVRVIENDKVQSSYMLIDAYYPNFSGTLPHLSTPVRRQRVFSGSHSFSGAALTKNDELMVRVSDSGIHQDFLNNWRGIPNCKSTAGETSANLNISGWQINAPGNDTHADKANGEWVDFTWYENEGCLDMSGWTLEDAQGHFAKFPRDTLIDAQGTLRVFSGCSQYPGAADLEWTEGTNFSYWFSAMNRTNKCAGVWNNAGDVLTLRDNRGMVVRTFESGPQ